MRVLDTQKKISWKSHGASISDSIIMHANSSISTRVTGVGKSRVKLVGRKLSGDGEVNIRIKNGEEIIFYKKINFTTKAYSEHSFSIENLKNLEVFEVFRTKQTFGRVEIARITIEDERENNLIKKNLKKKRSDRYMLDLLDNNVSKTNIAIVVPYSIYGGAEVYLKNILECTPSSFIVDILYLYKNNLEYKISGKNINHKLINSQDRLSATLVGNNYDSIIYYNSLNVYNLISKLKSMFKLNSKIIEIYHSDFLWKDAVAKIRTRKYIDYIFRIDENLAEDITGVDCDNKIFIPVGIDTKRFVRKEANELKASLSLPEDKHIFGIVARLSPEKNIQYAIDLIKNIEDGHLVIVGQGPLDNALKKYIEQNNITNVSFVGYRQDVENYYSLFDSFILTSVYEGMPISILEAMSCCLPIYSTDVGEISKNISKLDGVNILSGIINDDLNIIKTNFIKDNYFRNLRSFIVENYNIDTVSSKFFLSILGVNSRYVARSDESVKFSGEYI